MFITFRHEKNIKLNKQTNKDKYKVIQNKNKKEQGHNIGNSSKQ